ncbi:MAG: MlaD family protein [Verrucomicrobiota bacterium]|jgi:ABC-type transporter Mla subunit MlaD
MALQDLTPQLRTRLSHMERAVGWFVFLATALLLFCLGYYAYNKAESKGWGLVRARYYTYVNSAAGLKVLDPVTLMGFQVGEISGITTMPPRTGHNVRIAFVIFKVNQLGDPYYGYIWTEGSRVKLNSSDFLGSRSLEVTRGTNGFNIYQALPLNTLSLDEAEHLSHPEQWRLAENVYDENSNLVARAFTTLVESNLTRIARVTSGPLEAFEIIPNHPANRHHITCVWNNALQRYVKYNYRDENETNAYELTADESPAISDQLQAMVTQVQQALPNVLALTNKLAAVLDNATAALGNAAAATSNLNVTIVETRPVVTNFALVSEQLREPGGPVLWALGTNGNQELQSSLTNLDSLLGNTDTNLAALLINLADITSNLNAQVQANSNMLSGIAKTVADSDDFIQGLKRHWLLRSAFKKGNAAARTNAPAGKR